MLDMAKTYNKIYECRAINQSQALEYKQKNFKVWNTTKKAGWANGKNKPMPFYEAELIADSLNNGSIKP